MAKDKRIEIDELQFDDLNANNHTAEGLEMLEKSITQNKFGRSVLVDKDGRIIAGNGVVESAKKLGHTKVRVIETNGDELIAVKRTDLSLDSKEARELAIADNSIARVDLEWNEDNLKKIADGWGVAPEDWGVDMPEEKEFKEVEESDEQPGYKISYEIVFNDEAEQSVFFRFIKTLKERYNNEGTISERIVRFIKEHINE